MLELKGLTMKHGIEFSKWEFERLNQRQKKTVLEIMGGKTWLVKGGCLWTFHYNVTLNRFELAPWKSSSESAKSKELEKEIYEICEKLQKVKITKKW